jgi:hypothetical protein
MSKASSQQLASKLPNASSVACIGFSMTTLYAFYSMNARKERLKGQIQHPKEDFNRIKEESSERFKLGKDEFKCMPAIQEAQRLAKAQKLKWNEGNGEVKEYCRRLKESMKNDSSHQDNDALELDFVKSKEKDLEAKKMTLEDLLADERFRGVWFEVGGTDFSLADLQCLRDCMDCVLELLRTDEKRLGWSIEVAAAWNDCAKKREKIAHVLKDVKSARVSGATDT